MTSTTFVNKTTLSDDKWFNDADKFLYGIKHYGVDNTGATDCSIAMQAYLNDLETDATNKTTTSNPRTRAHFPPGSYLFKDVYHHPAVDVFGAGKANTTFELNTGAQVGGLICKARAVDATTGNREYTTQVADFTFDGNNAAAGAQFDALISFENANNDPNFPGGTTKGYNGGLIRNVLCFQSPGAGIHINPGRHRAHLEHCKTISNALDGIYIQGDDSMVTHCGSGSNGTSGVGDAMHANAVSGFLLVSNEIWGRGQNRTDDALAVRLHGVNGGFCVGNVIQDTIVLSGNDSNSDRGYVISSNAMRPLKGTFSSNGVPNGTAASKYNCFVYVQSYLNVTIGPQDWDQNSDDLAFGYLINADAAGVVAYMGSLSTNANSKAYAFDPYITHNGGTVQFIHSDPETNSMWISGTLLVDPNLGATPDNTYAAQFLGSRPVYFGNPVITNEPNCFVSGNSMNYATWPADGTATSQAVAVGAKTQHMQFTNSGTFTSTKTVIFPGGGTSPPLDGQRLSIKNYANLTTTATASTVITGTATHTVQINNFFTTLTGNEYGEWVYRDSAQTWHRRQ